MEDGLIKRPILREGVVMAVAAEQDGSTDDL